MFSRNICGGTLVVFTRTTRVASLTSNSTAEPPSRLIVPGATIPPRRIDAP
jgi:hypothetical protein